MWVRQGEPRNSHGPIGQKDRRQEDSAADSPVPASRNHRGWSGTGAFRGNPAGVSALPALVQCVAGRSG